MLHISVTLNCDGAAFEDYPDELHRILLEEVVPKAAALAYADSVWFNVKDSNGNTVGHVRGHREAEA